jgi:subtilisin family serine protease
VSASYSGVDSAAVGTSGTYIKGVGSLFLYAAGNDNRNLTGFSWPDTIVVGATTSNDAKASFSAYGPGVHVFAPGVNILSTTLGGGYGGASGTSMAAPVANGAVAMIFAANPTLTPQQAQDILENNCDNIGPSSIFSKGRINQYKNVNAAQTLNPIIEEPLSIVTVYGTHVAGTLADILVPNTGGASYDVQAVLPTRSMSIAGVELTYDIDSFSNLISLALTYEARVQPALIVTGFIYAWNYNTASYEGLGQFTMSGSSNWSSKTVTVSTNASRFVGPGGVVKTLVRAIGNVQGGRNMAQPFLFQFGHAKLKVVGQP